jgi:hypothetical protein
MSLLSAGGLRTGQAVGSTNFRGDEPKERPVAANDFLATVFHYLGECPSTGSSPITPAVRR